LNVEEYSALKQEQTQRIALRDASIHINIVTSVTILGFVVATDHVEDLLFSVPIVNFTLFWIYYINDHYIHAIRLYLGGAERANKPAYKWETIYAPDGLGTLLRRLASVVVVSIAFFAIPTYYLASTSIPRPSFGGAFISWLSVVALFALSVVGYFSQLPGVRKSDR